MSSCNCLDGGIDRGDFWVKIKEQKLICMESYTTCAQSVTSTSVNMMWSEISVTLLIPKELNVMLISRGFLPVLQGHGICYIIITSYCWHHSITMASKSHHWNISKHNNLLVFNNRQFKTLSNFLSNKLNHGIIKAISLHRVKYAWWKRWSVGIIRFRCLDVKTPRDY